MTAEDDEAVEGRPDEEQRADQPGDRGRPATDEVAEIMRCSLVER
jgi:hypothetical protein